MKLRIDENSELELVNKFHAEIIFQLVDTNREYLREWLPWLDLNKSVKDTINYIEQSEKMFSEKGETNFSIIVDNKIVGQIGLHSIDKANKKGKIGYWIGKDYQGKGTVTKACKTIENYCFEKINLNRIEICCATENFKSQAIAEKLNFKKEGTIREAEFLDAKFVDHFIYSKLKSEWKINE